MMLPKTGLEGIVAFVLLLSVACSVGLVTLYHLKEARGRPTQVHISQGKDSSLMTIMWYLQASVSLQKKGCQRP